MDFMTGITQSPTVGVRVLLETESFWMLWFVVVMKMIGTKLVHVCEGTLKCPIEWSKF